jgi:biotin transport system substrate-specific component
VTATLIHTPRRRTLADTLPGATTRDAILIVGFALLTAAAAQISIPLGFTPVPLTGQTFAVLLAGGTLGAARGSASQLLYLLLGLFLPFYADGESGFDVIWGTSGGYIVGFVIAAAVIGWMSERGQDRSVGTAVPAFLAGTVLIYTIGSVWLSYAADPNLPLTAGATEPSAITYGVAPFLVGDVLKAVLAGVLLPAAWRVRSLVEGDDRDD